MLYIAFNTVCLLTFMIERLLIWPSSAYCIWISLASWLITEWRGIWAARSGISDCVIVLKQWNCLVWNISYASRVPLLPLFYNGLIYVYYSLHAFIMWIQQKGEGWRIQKWKLSYTRWRTLGAIECLLSDPSCRTLISATARYWQSIFVG